MLFAVFSLQSCVDWGHSALHIALRMDTTAAFLLKQ
jgi:hypothetical protein